MATVNQWAEGARVRTLPAAAAPVLIGAGAAWYVGSFSPVKSLLALVVALALQIGVNLSNDYSDGIRGTDENRVGPVRLTASGAVSPRTVLLGAVACFALGGLAGLLLVAWSGHWWLLLIGGVAIAAAWFYTGGARPYGYAGIGLSELFVFLFFGLFATVGTTYVQTTVIPWWLWVSASGIGLISVALLMVNNLRDIPTDAVVGKVTLAVRLGPQRSRRVYLGLVTGAVVLGAIAIIGSGAFFWWVALPIMIAAAVPGARVIASGAEGRALLGALRSTGLSALWYGLALALTLVAGAGNLT